MFTKSVAHTKYRREGSVKSEPQQYFLRNLPNNVTALFAKTELRATSLETGNVLKSKIAVAGNTPRNLANMQMSFLSRLSKHGGMNFTVSPLFPSRQVIHEICAAIAGRIYVRQNSTLVRLERNAAGF